jgi:hypothetical protein
MQLYLLLCAYSILLVAVALLSAYLTIQHIARREKRRARIYLHHLEHTIR